MHWSEEETNKAIGKTLESWREEDGEELSLSFEDSEDNPVIIQFFGSSNGYYSETVDFRISP
jgi:hypothetical protein